MELSFQPIFPVSALQKKFSEIEAAVLERGFARITKNGSGAYVLYNEEALERRFKEIAEEAAYEQQVAQLYERGMAEYEAGKFVTGTDAAFAEAQRRYGKKLANG